MDDDVLGRSKSDDIRNSLAAMRRAARRAREVGKATGTGVVIQKNGRMVSVPPEELVDQPVNDALKREYA
jgi:hypothetical protein